MIKEEPVSSIIRDALANADGGELFLEECSSEVVSFKDGVVSDALLQSSQGFGLRAFCGDQCIFLNSSSISDEEVLRAALFIKSKILNIQSQSGFNSSNFHYSDVSNFGDCNKKLYTEKNPIDQPGFGLEEKINKLRRMYDYTVGLSKKIKSVTVSVSAAFQKVKIIKKDGSVLTDLRPICRLGVSVVVTDGKNFEVGTAGFGGRFLCDTLLENWASVCDKAFKQAKTNLNACSAPAGKMTVVLGSGWPGIILHEAVGHGLEADFNRKKTSVFSGLIGQKVASELVTIVDDGTLQNKRGSINIDDEGTPSACNMLIKDGILVGYMNDIINANIMHAKPTGNGRRQSYDCCPMPRMTNTYMLPGKSSADEIISGVKKGIYAVSFSGGQVDITSGKFVFSASESYMIENGKITRPIKGVTFIGDGASVLKNVSAVGDDLELDPGVGTCGKDGQSLPVGVGQPTIRVDDLTVGGSF